MAIHARWASRRPQVLLQCGADCVPRSPSLCEAVLQFMRQSLGGPSSVNVHTSRPRYRRRSGRPSEMPTRYCTRTRAECSIVHHMLAIVLFASHLFASPPSPAAVGIDYSAEYQECTSAVQKDTLQVTEALSKCEKPAVQ